MYFHKTIRATSPEVRGKHSACHLQEMALPYPRAHKMHYDSDVHLHLHVKIRLFVYCYSVWPQGIESLATFYLLCQEQLPFNDHSSFIYLFDFRVKLNTRHANFRLACGRDIYIEYFSLCLFFFYHRAWTLYCILHYPFSSKVLTIFIVKQRIKTQLQFKQLWSASLFPIFPKQTEWIQTQTRCTYGVNSHNRFTSKGYVYISQKCTLKPKQKQKELLIVYVLFKNPFLQSFQPMCQVLLLSR